MSRGSACDECLERAWFVSGLSNVIESAISGGPSGGACDLLSMSNSEIAAALGVDAERPTPGAAARRRALAESGCWAICRHDAAYPEALIEMGSAPSVLFGLGDAGLLAGEKFRRVTVVGARRPSAYGRELAESIARDLGSAGLVVVSGMAMGIDSCAHRGALSAGAPSVAVLGSGPDLPTPPRSWAIHRELIARGAVISELPPGTPARRWTFPARNRIMAWLSQITVVVEARARSGSLITVDFAHEAARGVGAVPGRVGDANAEGTNELLTAGAHVIRDGQDVLDSMLEGKGAAPQVPGRAAGPALDEVSARVLSALEDDGRPDAIATATGLQSDEVSGTLTGLELAGYAERSGSGAYRRTRLPAPSG